MYCEVGRGVPLEKANHDELDAVMCTLDSKIALVLRKLEPREGLQHAGAQPAERRERAGA